MDETFCYKSALVSAKTVLIYVIIWMYKSSDIH